MLKTFMIWLMKKSKADLRLGNPINEQIREYKRHGSKLIDGRWRNEKFAYTREDIIMPIIMYYRVSTPEAIEFKTRLGFNQHDLIMAKD